MLVHVAALAKLQDEEQAARGVYDFKKTDHVWMAQELHHPNLMGEMLQLDLVKLVFLNNFNGDVVFGDDMLRLQGRAGTGRHLLESVCFLVRRGLTVAEMGQMERERERERERDRERGGERSCLPGEARSKRGWHRPYTAAMWAGKLLPVRTDADAGLAVIARQPTLLFEPIMEVLGRLSAPSFKGQRHCTYART